jgi:hypothetical protein
MLAFCAYLLYIVRNEEKSWRLELTKQYGVVTKKSKITLSLDPGMPTKLKERLAKPSFGTSLTKLAQPLKLTRLGIRWCAITTIDIQ